MPDLETPAHRYRSSDDDISKENIIITDRSIDLAIEKVNVLSTGEPREGQAALRPTPAPLPLQPPEVQPTWCLVIPEQGDVLSLEDRQRLNAWDNENRQLARYSVKAVGDSAKSYAFHLKAWRGARLTDIIRQDPNVQAYHGLMAVVNQTRQDAADPEKRVQSVGAWFNGQVKAYFAAQGIDWNVVERLAGGSKAARRLSEPDPVPPLPDPILAVFRQQYLAEGSPPA